MALPAYQVPETATHVSPEDYLRLESESEYKHEYLNGQVVAMPGPALPTTVFAPTSLLT